VNTAAIMTWEHILVIGLAGGLGAIARYLLSRLIVVQVGSAFPWATLGVNMLGCLVFGLVWGLAAARDVFSDTVRIMLLVGFLGAFTTFSSFAYETLTLMREFQWLPAIINILAQNIGGIAALLVGIGISRLF